MNERKLVETIDKLPSRNEQVSSSILEGGSDVIPCQKANVWRGGNN